MYLALYRKYRPETFRDVISQEHITRTLQNQLKTGQLAHAYLFTGTRGTGKTTCAKILAKAVNCLHPVDGNPCLECESCRKIAEGSTDIVEMDAASNNSVDDVRQLRDEIVYTPIDVKYKVYIIDEVHMLSASAFNALLKTIEEPPSHIIFILATTDAHKVPATILSRCQRYQFRKIDPNDCAERLSEVAQKENALLHKDAALLLARLADGAMRDALSLLDQCVSTANEVTLQTVRECCGVAGSDALFAISAAAARKDGAAALKVVDELIRNSKDMTRFVDELTVHYRNLLLLKTVPDSGLVTVTDEEKPLYEEQLRQYSLEMIMRCLDILTGCLDDINRMKQTSQLRIMVEMVALRLCTPKLDSDTKALSMRIDELERRLNRGEFALTQAQPGETSATAHAKPQPARLPMPAPQTASQLTDSTPPWEEAPEQSGFVDETGFAMPPQTVLTAQTGPEPATSPASAPQTASQLTDDTPPWEEAPEQSGFVDETGFAMPPQTVLTAQTGPEPAASPASAPQTASQPTDDTPPWEEAPEQSGFVDETGFAMPPQTVLTAQTGPEPATSPASAPQTASQLADDTPPWEEAPEQSGFVDETGFAMPPQTVLTAQTGPEPAASPASAPQTASQLADDTPPWEEAPEQSGFVDETGFAMPPQTAEKPSPPPSATLSGQEGSRMQAAAHSTKQPIAVSGIFPDELENEPPVREWLEIVDALPPVMKGLMASSKAYHHDGLVVICVGAAAKTVLSDGVRADILRDAVSAELGREYPLVLAAEENRSKPRQDKLGDFLTLASEKGIQIITKNSSK